jgi:hypothetical protein
MSAADTGSAAKFAIRQSCDPIAEPPLDDNAPGAKRSITTGKFLHAVQPGDNLASPDFQ